MKNNNLNYQISKKYVKDFISLAKKQEGLDIKLIKQINGKIIKYDDLSYLKEILNDENKDLLIKMIDLQRTYSSKNNYEEIINNLDNLFATYFENKEILDIAGIKLSLNKIDKQLHQIINPIYVSDINPLINLKDLIMSELEVYILKHKANEYVEMSHIRDSILKLINACKEKVRTLQSNLTLDSESYYLLFIEKLNNCYQIILDSKKDKANGIPEWGKGLLFAAPWIIGFIIFTLYPLITTMIFSFSSVELTPNGFETEFIGFTNYINIFTKDTDFIYAISDYIVEIIIYVPLITIFSLLIALLLNSKVKGTGFFRTIFFLPVIITSGPVMKILIEQGVTSIPGLAELINLEEISAKLPRFINTALDVLTNEFIMILWFCGIQILVFITGLQKIDKGVYEAANIDGASRWERFWKVTIPAINPTIVINVVFTIVMQSLFALNPIILKIQEDMNDSSGIKGYGYSSAIAFTYFLVMIVLLVIFVLIFKRRDKKVRKEHN